MNANPPVVSRRRRTGSGASAGEGVPARCDADALRVGGLVPCTSIDFPGELAAVLFVRGCPLRCTYCHNPHLQMRGPQPGDRDWPSMRRWLQTRRGLIDAVVFSGGEPTIDPALPAAIDEVRALGYKVGLHTAGVYPDRVRALADRLDWVGLDVKASLASTSAYRRVVGVAASPAPVMRTLQALLAHGVAVECRTTVHPALHTQADLLAIGDALAAAGVRRYALQRVGVPAAMTGHDPGVVPMGAAPADWPSAATLARLGDRFERFSVRAG